MRNTTPWFCCQYLFWILVGCLLPVERVGGDARAHTIRVMCGKQSQHNSTIHVLNFVATMQNISRQISSSGFGVAVRGTGPDSSHSFAQCYGDLTLPDCIFCYSEARSTLQQCYPRN